MALADRLAWESILLCAVSTSATDAAAMSSAFAVAAIEFEVVEPTLIHGDQLVGENSDFSVVKFQVQPPDERAMTTRLDDRRAIYEEGCMKSIVGMAA